jgi:hypothetical protein
MRCRDRSCVIDRGSRLRPLNLPPTAKAGTTEDMAKGKPTPDKSKIERDRPLAYSRRQKGGGGADDDAPSVDSAKAEGVKPEAGKPEAAKTEAAKTEAPKAAEAKAEAPKGEAPKGEAPKGEAPKSDAPSAAKAGDASATEASEPASSAAASSAAPSPEASTIQPPPPKGEPWPDATPQPMRPVEPARARTETVAMPAELGIGGPPAMPASNPGSVEDPTHMPGPGEIPGGNPGDPASPPGRVPSGDSRSLRKGQEFALVYRVQTAVISRFGVVGTRGQWRVVDYPTSSSASNAYAKEVSRFVAEGFSDYRD